MTPRDWLILFLGFEGSGESPVLDPVRCQKGMFLVANEAGVSSGEAYVFEPYHYGPYSRTLRRDLVELVAEGLAVEKDVPGYSWKRYHLTVAGLEVAQEALDSAPRETAVKVAEIKRRVTEFSFNQLLKSVYANYPDYAARSVFSG